MLRLRAPMVNCLSSSRQPLSTSFLRSSPLSLPPEIHDGSYRCAMQGGGGEKGIGGMAAPVVLPALLQLGLDGVSELSVIGHLVERILPHGADSLGLYRSWLSAHRLGFRIISNSSTASCDKVHNEPASLQLPRPPEWRDMVHKRACELAVAAAAGVACTLLVQALVVVVHGEVVKSSGSTGRVVRAGRRLQAAEPPLRSILLFRKPDVPTGQLEPVEEGLDVLRAQTEPFAIVSAVGPTRTGKSTILGRAFMPSGSENVFEVGSGVVSHTGGVWITDRPVTLRSGDGRTIRVLFIDTEGFGGVGGLTSRTYEANLFSVVYMLSSALIFNTMFPVDAHMVAQLNARSSRTLDMMRELSRNSIPTRRRVPPLFWTVQSFNLYNLRNSGMRVEDLMSNLRNSSHKKKSTDHGTRSALLGSAAASASGAFVADGLFDHVDLLPIRRPHSSDKVVANIANYSINDLNPEYMDDAHSLQRSTLDSLQPVHLCKQPLATALAPKWDGAGCLMVPFNGSNLAFTLTKWLQFGHLVDPGETPEAANETEVLSTFGDSQERWFTWQCGRVSAMLRSKLRSAFSTVGAGMTGAALEAKLESLGEAPFKQAMRYIKQLPRRSMVFGIESGTFWQYPSKVATYIESRTQEQTQGCVHSIFALRKTERERHRQALGMKPRAGVPPSKSDQPVQLLKQKDGTIGMRRISPARLASVRKKARKLVSVNDAKVEKLGRAREECFVVYD